MYISSKMRTHSGGESKGINQSGFYKGVYMKK